MQNKMPIIACTDPNTDIGDIITQGNFGWWCQSNNPQRFTQTVDLACNADLQTLGNIGYEYLMAHYTVEDSYNIITKNLKK